MNTSTPAPGYGNIVTRQKVDPFKNKPITEATVRINMFGHDVTLSYSHSNYVNSQSESNPRIEAYSDKRFIGAYVVEKYQARCVALGYTNTDDLQKRHNVLTLPIEH